MSWCCPTSGDEHSAIKTLGYARNDDGAKRYQNSAAFLIFMRRTNPVEPLEPIEPAEPLSHVIKGQHALEANPEPLFSLDTLPHARL